MIPKQKISERILVTNPYTDQRLIEGYQSGFKAGARFAETEMKHIACEFTEWCGSEGWVQEVQANNWKNVLDNKIPALVRMSTKQLFDKFLSERSEQ